MSYINTHCPDLSTSISVQRLEHNDQLLNALLSNAHTVLQLSIREGFEVKVSEALKKGRPVIVSRVGGIQLQVLHERNGFLIEPGDWQAAGRHLLRLWTDHDLYDRMSGEATRTVSDEVGTVGNALAWFYLANKFREGGVAAKERWVNDLARAEVGSAYGKGENKLPREATLGRQVVEG